MKKMFALALFAGLALTGAAKAEKQDFTLVNKTGYEIDKVYVAPSKSDNWEEDVLGDDSLDDGETFDMHFTDYKTCKFDIKVVYSDGDTAVWSALDLCAITKVTLRWNKKSGETTAVLD